MELGTGTLATAPDRRQVRINGAPASVNALAEWLSVLWLTPAMDRLFTDSAGARRRFLDRLVLALEPGHAHHAARYEAAMRARNKLLAEPDSADPAWLAALEAGMAEHGAALAEARARHRRRARRPPCREPRRRLRPRRARAGRRQRRRPRPASSAPTAAATPPPAAPPTARTATTSPSPTAPTMQPASRCSTGEQKALLLGIVLGHADLVADRRGAAPILLLDEVAAHLDPGRRAALFARLEGRGQVWMTATEPALFEGIASATHYAVAGGQIRPR